LACGAVGAFALTRHERGATQRHPGFDPPRGNRADAQRREAARPAGEQQHYKKWSRRRRAACKLQRCRLSANRCTADASTRSLAAIEC
jgi:hypothetical protein